jgi:hypothetical protein
VIEVRDVDGRLEVHYTVDRDQRALFIITLSVHPDDAEWRNVIIGAFYADQQAYLHDIKRSLATRLDLQTFPLFKPKGRPST